MRPLSIEEIKQIEFNILKDVAKFCDKHQIRYYLSGGTLLGAVRHKGFIPWDDDIDISMPREDYLRFVLAFNGFHEHYEVKSIEIDKKYWRPFAKVFDKRTSLVESFIRIPTPGNAIFIDVFPIDGIPDNEIKQWLFFKEQELLKVLYAGSAYSLKKSHKFDDSVSKFSNIKGRLRTVFKYTAICLFGLLPTYKLISIINKNASKYPYEECKYIGAIVDCAHGASCEKMEKEKYEPRIQFEFEGYKFWGPRGFEEYLTRLYGNYRELPPEERRVTHHDFEAYWKD